LNMVVASWLCAARLIIGLEIKQQVDDGRFDGVVLLDLKVITADMFMEVWINEDFVKRLRSTYTFPCSMSSTSSE
ncbi:hypothetical protein Tco_0518018, partial [Tanacetum coccineum]